ncbi:MAG: ArnT family glycosyltransferase, partial [Gemmataceae bacterium]
MTDEVPPSAPHFWAEREFWCVIALVIVAFVIRINALPLRGEESRWAQGAAELAAAGDWIVPRHNGEVFASRPPLHSWLIGASAAVFGVREPWVPRVPSVVAVVLVAVLLYGYGRQFLGRAGAVAAALAYPTCGEVLQQGREAETEAVYVLFLSASLILWHWGYLRKWPAWGMWTAGYVCMVLACLCKGGLQPPVYFAGTVGLYLIWNRNLRVLVTPSHAIGLIIGAAAAGAWVLPCMARVGWEQTRHIWFADTASRFDPKQWAPAKVLAHLVNFPAEVFGCLMPWGILAVALLVPVARRLVVRPRPEVVFAAFAVLVAFPTCWIPPGGQTRYLTPLYPLIAVLIGAAVDFLDRGNVFLHRPDMNSDGNSQPSHAVMQDDWFPKNSGAKSYWW